MAVFSLEINMANILLQCFVSSTVILKSCFCFFRTAEYCVWIYLSCISVLFRFTFYTSDCVSCPCSPWATNQKYRIELLKLLMGSLRRVRQNVIPKRRWRFIIRLIPEDTGWSRYWQIKKNSMVWVRERTIPTERPPLVGEVVANFYG
jgi:hypothetical protein